MHKAINKARRNHVCSSPTARWAAGLPVNGPSEQPRTLCKELTNAGPEGFLRYNLSSLSEVTADRPVETSEK